MTKRLVLLVAALAAACTAEGGRPKPVAPPAPPLSKLVQLDPTAEDYVSPQLPRGRVRLTDAFGGQHVVDVEIAHTRDARTRGLMWRRSLEAGKGMLFLFAEQQDLNFWMHNCFISIDMIFMDASRHIVGIVENAPPHNDSARGPGHPAQYVLEVPAGWSQQVGLKVGSAAEFEGTQGLEVEGR